MNVDKILTPVDREPKNVGRGTYPKIDSIVTAFIKKQYKLAKVDWKEAGWGSPKSCKAAISNYLSKKPKSPVKCMVRNGDVYLKREMPEE